MADKGKFVLTYFNVTGRGEGIRWLLAFGKADFKDNRFEFGEWPKIKPTMPIQRAPLLEWTSPDGKQTQKYVQSGSIMRIVAAAFGLNGKTPCEKARAEETFECLREFQELFYHYKWEDPSEENKKNGMIKLVKEDIPRLLGYVEKFAKQNGNKNLAGGDGFTHADIFCGSLYDVFKKNAPEIDITTPCPGLAAIAKAVSEDEGIKAYLAKRPDIN